MNSRSLAETETTLSSPETARAAEVPARTFYWSVRRELWENRSIVVAPLAVALVGLLGFAIGSLNLPERRRALLLLDPAGQRAALERPYDVVAMILLLTSFLVGLVYCLDALHGERRDRGILFWKSLPVSDRTTVLSKAFIPLGVLPALTFAVIVGMQLIMVLWSGAVVLLNGLPALEWTHLPLPLHSLFLLYGLVVLALWHAPLYGWLLLISGWARRAPYLWVVLPPLAISVLEKTAFNSSRFASLLKDRMVGGIERAFAFDARGNIDTLAQLTPGRFLSSPGLWIGLAFAALFLAGAVRLRRARGPI